MNQHWNWQQTNPRHTFLQFYRPCWSEDDVLLLLYFFYKAEKIMICEIYIMYVTYRLSQKWVIFNPKIVVAWLLALIKPQYPFDPKKHPIFMKIQCKIGQNGQKLWQELNYVSLDIELQSFKLSVFWIPCTMH